MYWGGCTRGVSVFIHLREQEELKGDTVLPVEEVGIHVIQIWVEQGNILLSVDDVQC